MKVFTICICGESGEGAPPENAAASAFGAEGRKSVHRGANQGETVIVAFTRDERRVPTRVYYYEVMKIKNNVCDWALPDKWQNTQ